MLILHIVKGPDMNVIFQANVQAAVDKANLLDNVRSDIKSATAAPCIALGFTDALSTVPTRRHNHQ